MLATRLLGIKDWIEGQSNLNKIPLGYFGASTGAAAALITAADRPMSRELLCHAAADRISLVTCSAAFLRCVRLLSAYTIR
jgi:hypothetical protein